MVEIAGAGGPNSGSEVSTGTKTTAASPVNTLFQRGDLSSREMSGDGVGQRINPGGVQFLQLLDVGQDIIELPGEQFDFFGGQ